MGVMAETATMAAGTNGSTATVNEQAAIKVGTSRLGGSMTITVGAGATTLEFYAAAWNGVSGLGLMITPANKVVTSAVQLTSDSGISGNSPFTLTGSESTYKFTIALSNITTETTLTLTGSDTKRFVVWGATYTTSDGGKQTAVINANYKMSMAVGDAADVYTVSYNGDGALSVTSSNTAVATATLAAGNVTVTPVAAGTTTITISAPETENYTSASKSYNLNVSAPLTTMDAIFAAATTAGSTATDALVTFNNWVVSGVKNNNAYVTDNAGKGFIVYASGHGFTVGDILSGTVACKVQLYRGAAELTALTSTTDGLTVTTGGVITPVTTIALAGLSGVNTGAVLSYENLQYNGTAFTDGETTITPYSTLIDLPTLISGKSYNVTGMYVQFNATKEIAPRSAEDFELVEIINNYTVTFGVTENGTIVVKNGETVINNGDEVAEGTELTIECTPANEDYRFKNWQYKEGEGSWNTRYTNPQDYTMPSANVQFRANFELIPVYTVAWSVNGAIVKTDNLKEGAAVTAPADPEVINGKVFTGWIETATVVGATPAYVTPSATATKDVTYYAVFATYDSEATPDQWQTTTLSALTSSDVFVMASGTNAISSANGTSGNPAAVALTVSAGAITSEVTDDIKWTLTGNATDGYIFYKNGSTNYLYINTTASSGSNTCVRVGTQNSNIRNNWKPDNNGYLKTNDSYTVRYLSFYSTGSDFRGYVNTSNGAFAPTFYKLIPGGDVYSDFSTTVAEPLPAHGTLNFVAENNDGYWATFSSSENVIFDANDVVVYTAAVDGDALVLLDANNNSLSCVTDKTKDAGWVAGYYVQANTGVLVYSLENSVNYYYSEANGSNILNNIEEYNMLKAASVAMEGDFKFYKLAYDDYSNKSGLGFYYGAAGGAAFTAKAGGAYLAVPAPQAAPIRYIIGSEHTATAMDNIEANENVLKVVENGQLIIIKNGVRFNALGQIVK